MEAYVAGEEPFALRRTKYPELMKTKKEVALLDQLYGLYMDVIERTERLIPDSYGKFYLFSFSSIHQWYQWVTMWGQRRGIPRKASMQ